MVLSGDERTGGRGEGNGRECGLEVVLIIYSPSGDLYFDVTLTLKRV